MDAKGAKHNVVFGSSYSHLQCHHSLHELRLRTITDLRVKDTTIFGDDNVYPVILLVSYFDMRALPPEKQKESFSF